MDTNPGASGNQNGNNPPRQTGRKESIKNKLQHFLGPKQTTNIPRENVQSSKNPTTQMICSLAVLKVLCIVLKISSNA